MNTVLLRWLAVAGFAAVLACVTGPAWGDDPPSSPAPGDLELLAGTWRIVKLEVGGQTAPEEDVFRLTVVNGKDGTWSLQSDNSEVAKGTSVLDPSASPKKIDFSTIDGEQSTQEFLGIYEIEDQFRKLCFAPAKEGRPTEFRSQPGSGWIYVELKKERGPE